MTSLLVLRHGPTEWTEARRLQGRADPPLSDAGRRDVAGWRLAAEDRRRVWYASPLDRTRETATLLGLSPRIDERLVEMDWGDWEGRTLAELRAADPDGMAREEARGLDMCPPGGESPRQAQARLLPFLREIAAIGVPAGAVTHRGIIRVLYAAADGWDMRGAPPVRLAAMAAHRFQLATDGAVSVERLNMPLSPS